MVACPYGRWQSALLDNDSLIVAYDFNRGEPRGKGKDRQDKGDCVDCAACVTTCPTGIDIRNGLQMECIHCTQCMDACDAVMRKVGKPEGLIRYSSRAALAGKGKHFLRIRTALYPTAFALFFGAFIWQLTHKDAADVTLLGPAGAPFTVQGDGSVTNQLRVRIANRSGIVHAYAVEVTGAEGLKLIAPMSPLPVQPGRTETMPLFVTVPEDVFEHGVRTVTVKVTDGGKYAASFPYRLAGPLDHEDDERASKRRGGEHK
jgi:cytochrome c oxidase accessory protein FixG